MPAPDLETWLIEHYLSGQLPLPEWLVRFMLDFGIAWHYHFASTWDVLPPELAGDQGPIAERSEDLMRIHYDKPAVLFENFLGASMKYSMGLWETGAQTLEDAQERMLSDLCAKAGIRDGDTILDVGCGFGSFAVHALRSYPRSKIVGLTLSDVQYRYINEKQGQPGHPLRNDRFRVIKEDFAKCTFGRDFDRIVSIGVLEHVANLKLALQKLADFLRPEGSVMLHFIVYNRITKTMASVHKDGFFARYVFPGGRFWPFNELPRYAGHLRVEKSWFLNGGNYRRTLECWRGNLQRNLDRIRAHPGLDERFLQLWEFYLRFCIAIFHGRGGRNVGNGQYLLRHARAVT
jgi:cyclopropane-fatty-acyl-phospholipid synthase